MNADAEKDPKVREEAAAWFKRMEDGDEEALKNWRVWRELSVKKYEEEYARLNVHFDEYTGESKVGPQTMDAALKKLQELGLIEEDNGALRVNLEKYKLGKAVVRKRGASSNVARSGCQLLTYIRRRYIDLSHARHRWGHRAVRKVQVRQDDLRRRCAAGSAPRTILQGS